MPSPSRRAFALALLLTAIALQTAPPAFADDCHSDHYCGICLCRLYFRGSPPTEVPVIAGIAPRNCVCPYSHSMPSEKRCAPGDIGEDSFVAPFPRPRPNLNPNVDGATYGGSRPEFRESSGGSAPAKAEEAQFILDPRTVPREIQFGPAPPQKLPKPKPAPLPEPAPPPLPPLRLQ